MRFAIVCLLAATAVTVSSAYPRYDSQRSQPYGFRFENSPSDQYLNAIAGEGNDNFNNQVIADSTQLNGISNENSGNVRYANSPIHQRVLANSGKGQNNHGNLAAATGKQDNSIVNKNRPGYSSTVDLENAPVYQDATAEVANGDNLAIANAYQDNRVENDNGRIRSVNSPIYQHIAAKAEGTDNDTRQRTAIANADQNNALGKNKKRQNGTARASGYGNFKSTATVDNVDPNN
ncbi:AAC-rich mRNA clone AAC11 protein-like [Microplitis mediator]|uniref:AAC-rich mRNA clone AAC11 protein-like n=1 Tax=Microplitis mediator TaxID=375433 RepID=UPI002556B699|nr:AAC-rich mRNA clone AAC11 protein-like [Microplitis mediator]